MTELACHDPTCSVLDFARAALSAAGATVAALTADRDAWRMRAERAEAEVARRERLAAGPRHDGEGHSLDGGTNAR